MHHFHYRDGRLHCEDVPLDTIADQVGTPCYVYSTATLTRHYNVLADAFDGSKYLIAYSVKACGNIGVAKTLAGLGAGADVVSGGELYKALHAGIPASRIVFSGVGKTRDELKMALDAGIHQFNVESLPEMERLSQIAADMGKVAPVAFRVNPHVDAGGHANISTGGAEHKFGIAWHEAGTFYQRARDLPGIDPVGVDVHIGSQITDISPMRIAFEKVVTLVKQLRAEGFAISRMDLGGGLGIPYNDEQAPPPAAYGAMVKEVVGPLGCHVTFEPGRLIAGNAGVLVTRVLYAKDGSTRRFVIVDAAMNDLIRPALYDAYHAIVPVAEPAPGSALHPVDVVGPICETGDTFAVQRHLPAVKPGDLLAIRSAGAYGAVMASTYNGRPLVPEVLVSGGDHAVVRRRVEAEEFMAFDALPPWLAD